MTNRIAATFVAIFVAALIAAPIETLARGGFSGAHALAFHGGIARPIGRPAIAHIPSQRFVRFSNHRRVSAPVLWGVSPWYGDYSSAEVAPQEQQPLEEPPLNAVTEEETPVRLPSWGCTERSYKVPSEAGGERLIKVVHC